MACEHDTHDFSSVQLGCRNENYSELILNPDQFKPVDSVLKVKIGDPAPDFTLTSILVNKITLSHYKNKKIVVISFAPTAEKEPRNVALFIIDKQGIIRNRLVKNINGSPPLDFIVKSLDVINNVQKF